MKVKRKLLTLIVTTFLFWFCYPTARGDVVPPELPENRIYILYVAVAGIDHVRSYMPFTVAVYIFNPDTSGHRYEVLIEFQTCVDQREGFVLNMSLARVRVTLTATFHGASTIYIHLWQDKTHVEHLEKVVIVEKGSLEQTIEDLSSEIGNLQTALDDSNMEIDNLRAYLDASKTNIDNLQLQLNKMCYIVIWGFVALIMSIATSAVLLYRKIKAFSVKV